MKRVVARYLFLFQVKVITRDSFFLSLSLSRIEFALIYDVLAALMCVLSKTAE